MNATNALKMRSTLKIDNPVTCMEALKNGDAMVKLSAVVMGLGNMAHKQVAKGLLFLAAEVAYIAFMVMSGFHNLAMLPSLGTVERQARKSGTRSCKFLSTPTATSPSCFCSTAWPPSC